MSAEFHARPSISSLASPSTASPTVPVGVAAVDITPDYPIRMVGYGSRQTESEGIASRLKAKALAIGDDKDEKGGPAVLVAVDNCGVGGDNHRRGRDPTPKEGWPQA